MHDMLGAFPVRFTPDGLISVLDVLGALGYTQPKVQWSRMCKTFPNFSLVTSNVTLQKETGNKAKYQTPFAPQEVFFQIAGVSDKERAEPLREWLAKIGTQVAHGDVKLAEEIVTRAVQLNPEQTKTALAASTESPLLLFLQERRAQDRDLVLQVLAKITTPSPLAPPPLPSVAEIQAQTQLLKVSFHHKMAEELFNDPNLTPEQKQAFRITILETSTGMNLAALKAPSSVGWMTVEQMALEWCVEPNIIRTIPSAMKHRTPNYYREYHTSKEGHRTYCPHYSPEAIGRIKAHLKLD
jgi:prophage antirepressor-like protein